MICTISIRANQASSVGDRRVATPWRQGLLAIFSIEASAPHHIRSNMHLICAYALHAPSAGAEVPGSSFLNRGSRRRPARATPTKTLGRFLLILWFIRVDRYKTVLRRGGFEPVHVLLHPRPPGSRFAAASPTGALGYCTASANMARH